MSDSWWAMLAIQLALTAPLALFLAWALRASGVPGGKRGEWGGGALGGLIAAVLIGPAILGRVTPEFHARVFEGATIETAALNAAATEIGVRTATLRATGVSEAAITEATRDFDHDLQPLRDVRTHALQSHRGRSWWLIVCLASLHTAMGVATMLPTSPRLWSVAGRTLLNQRARPAGAGAFMLLLTAAPVALALSVAPGLSGPPLIAAALIFAVPGFAPLVRRGSAPVFLAALCAFVVGCILFFALTPTIEMFTVAAFACFGAMMGLGWPDLVRRARKPITTILACVTLPAMVALAGAQVDPTQWTAAGPAWKFIIPILIALLWASDGRWAVLIFASRMLSTRAAHPWTSAARQVNTGSGSIELVLTIVWSASALEMNAGDDRVLAAALIGVVVIEMTREIRLRVAQMLDTRDAP